MKISVVVCITLCVSMLISACANSKETTPVVEYDDLIFNQRTQVPDISGPSGGSPLEVIVYASDLLPTDLYELDFYDDPGSPSGKFIGLPNHGDELDPPPENDPNVTFITQVKSGIPYRCWIHMKVGEPKGVSQANIIWVQFSESVDRSGTEIYRPKTRSYLAAQGLEREGWQWVGCNASRSTSSDSMVYFKQDGEVTIRLQAGAEGVGFDQFVLSPEKFLTEPPVVAILDK